MKAAVGFSLGAALVVVATLGRPFWWSAAGMAAVAVATLALMRPGLRPRFAPLALVLVAVAIVAGAFAYVRG